MNSNEQLWSSSISSRLSSVWMLSEADIGSIQEELCRGCPVKPWPYGSPTSVNPWLAVLGLSPGSSPTPGDINYEHREPILLPTAGMPHPDICYHDTARYFARIRTLATTLLMPDAGSDDNALTLFANMNLDTRERVKPEDVVKDPRLAIWILETLRDKLRPRILVLVGLKGHLEENRQLRSLFEEVFKGFRLAYPLRKCLFKGHTGRNSYYFSEWELRCPDGHEVLIVMWPNHPSRHPFADFDLWKAACGEFRDRHVSLLR